MKHNKNVHTQKRMRIYVYTERFERVRIYFHSKHTIDIHIRCVMVI